MRVQFHRIGALAVAAALGAFAAATSLGASDSAARQGDASTAAPSAAGLQVFVESNIREALSSLGAGAAGSTQRGERFRALMGRFADINAISTNVLGRYAGGLRNDAALRRDWEAAFTEYAFATYEDQLDRFRGFTVRANGETINRPNQDAIVSTLLTPANGGRPVTVQWRMLNRGAGWRVYDVLVNLRGNELWLGLRQKRQFEAELDKTRGDIRALIAVVRQDTANIRARLAQMRR
jgi:ABC-type transporter MlaC component